ncbi:hypothetical protein AAULH_14421, partial [Lactobacillus helveticus MTCC 5463]
EHSGGWLHPGAEASVLLGHLCAPALAGRSGLHPEARTAMDPDLRLVRGQAADDPRQSRRQGQGHCAGDRAHQARNGQWPPADHLSRMHTPPSGCDARI